MIRCGAQRCCDPKIQALNPHGAYEGTECGTRRLIDPAIQSTAAQVARALQQVGLAPRLDTVPPPTPEELLASRSTGLPIATVQTRAGHRFALLPPPVEKPVTTPATPTTVTTAAGLAAATDTRALADRCTDRRLLQICDATRRDITARRLLIGTITGPEPGATPTEQFRSHTWTWADVIRVGAQRCCDQVIQALNPAGPFANTDCPRALVTPRPFRARPPARAIPGLPKRRLVRLAPLSPVEVQARAPDPVTVAPPPQPWLVDCGDGRRWTGFDEAERLARFAECLRPPGG